MWAVNLVGANVKRYKPLRKDQFPPPGTVYLMPLADGRRFGVCRVARHSTAEEEGHPSEPHMIVVASPALFDAPPSMDDPRVKETLVLTHHGYAERRAGRAGPAVSALNLAVAAPGEFKVLGRVEPTVDDVALTCNLWGGWLGLAFQVLTQWRWDHERDAVVAEDKLKEEQELRERTAQLSQRAKPVPLATLRKERLLEDWQGTVPAALLRKCRAILRSAIDELIALGPRPKRAAAMKVLRACTEALNELDEAEGHFIETIEREDLCDAIDRLAMSVGIETKESVADRWRDW
jgi:hypothetical protein